MISVIPKEKHYTVIISFSSEDANILANPSDVVFKNCGDNNFYLEQFGIGIRIIRMLDWSLAMKAIRYGWLELVKVEDGG